METWPTYFKLGGANHVSYPCQGKLVGGNECSVSFGPMGSGTPGFLGAALAGSAGLRAGEDPRAGGLQVPYLKTLQSHSKCFGAEMG